MAVHTAKPEHEVVYQDLIALVNKRAKDVTPVEILAIASNMVGKLIAMQDQRNISPETALEIVQHNVEAGNKQVVDQLQQTKGGRS